MTWFNGGNVFFAENIISSSLFSSNFKRVVTGMDIISRFHGAVLSYTRNFPHFVEPAGWLTDAQVFTTCPSLGRDQSSPCPSILLLKDQFWCYPPTTPRSSKWVFFRHVSPPKPCAHLFFHLYVLHAQPISFLIWKPDYYLVRST